MKKMKRIALIRTPIIQPETHVGSLRAVPSIGIAYINAQLKKNNFETIVIDSPGEGINQFSKINETNLIINGLVAEQIISKIPDDVDLIAISVMHTNEWIYDKFIIKKIHEKFPQIKILLGGENATAQYESILNELPEVTAIILGEADLIVGEVARRLMNGSTLDGIPSVAYQDDTGIQKNERSSNIKNLGELEKPDWTDFPIENYFSKNSSISGFNYRSLTMTATRGCPHFCTFCTVPNMWNAKWNARDPQDVIEEILYYKKMFDVHHIDFVDLTFALNKKWTVDFCTKLIEQKVNINWSLPIGTRVESLDKSVIQLLREAGCIRVLYSPESGSGETLIRIKKKLKINDMEIAIRESVKAGLIVKLATIFGFPGQTLKEALWTILFIIKSAFWGVQDVVCLCFVPYPGTELYDDLIKSGKLNPEKEEIRLNNDLKNMKSWSEYISSRQVRLISFLGMSLFYTLQYLIRPWRIIILIQNVFIKKAAVTNFESLIFNKLSKRSIRFKFYENLNLK
jgi:anaerobic magnesium-protoporphyrin IX monomethyl ester cyclase